MDLAVLLAALLGLLIVKALLFQPRNPSSPPCIRSWIPWFGAAFQFGKAPLEFIEQARKKVINACAGLPASWVRAHGGCLLGERRPETSALFCSFLSRFIMSGALKWGRIGVVSPALVSCGSDPGTIILLEPLPKTSAFLLLLQSGCVLILVSDNVESSVPRAGTRKLFICCLKLSEIFEHQLVCLNIQATQTCLADKVYHPKKS